MEKEKTIDMRISVNVTGEDDKHKTLKRKVHTVCGWSCFIAFLVSFAISLLDLIEASVYVGIFAFLSLIVYECTEDDSDDGINFGWRTSYGA